MWKSLKQLTWIAVVLTFGTCWFSVCSRMAKQPTGEEAERRRAAVQQMEESGRRAVEARQSCKAEIDVKMGVPTIHDPAQDRLRDEAIDACLHRRLRR